MATETYLEEDGTILPAAKKRAIKAREARHLRTELGLTQKQIAEHVEKTVVTICNWERGAAEVPLLYLRYLRLLHKRHMSVEEVENAVRNIRDSLDITTSEEELQDSILETNPWELPDGE